MKTTIILFCLLATCQYATAGENNTKGAFYGGRVKFEDLRKQTVVKFSPFHFFDRSIQLNGEFFKANYKTSLVVGFTGTYRDDKRVSDQGASLELQLRHYPRAFLPDTSAWSQNSAAGFYVGFSVSAGTNVYKSINDTWDINTNMLRTTSSTTNSHWVTPSVLLGYQIIVWESMYLDFYAGGGIKVNDVKRSSSDPFVNLETEWDNGSIFSRYYKGILPKLGLTIGVGL